ncbi:Nif11-like leader peptide family natural product precursor [Janthinobacterium sp. LB3P112]|uniref:Nif11-like leader peptide family natural product precursor n=1 Tax=Janthinobacterium sp. LB3P112 TaxID=3424196 RepID=UPI003F27B5C1
MQKFIDAVNSNPNLQKELSEAVRHASIAVAKKHGFEHTESDVKKYTSNQQVGCVSTAWTAVCSV